MTPLLRSLAATVVLLAVSACGNNDIVAEFNGVSVKVKSDGLFVSNHTDSRLAVYAADESYDAQFPVSRCADSSDACLRVPVGGSLLVPFSDVPGFQPQMPMAIYTWTITNGVIVEVADFHMATP